MIDLMQYPNLAADDRVRAVVAEALAAGEAHIEERDGVAWYVDPLFGPDVPVGALAYSEEIGLYVRPTDEKDL